MGLMVMRRRDPEWSEQGSEEQKEDSQRGQQ